MIFKQTYLKLIFCCFVTLISDAVFSQKKDTTITINNIVIVGNKTTKKHIITRELPFDIGDELYTSDTALIFARSRYNIFNTQLFNFVAVSYADETFFITVEEKWYFIPFPVVELADRNFNEWWTQRGRSLKRINLGFRFRYENFRGRKELLKVVTQVGFTDKFELYYDIPYINKQQQTGLGFEVSYAANNSVAYRTLDHVLDYYKGEHVNGVKFRGGMRLIKRPSLYFNHQIGLYYHQNHISDTIASLNANFYGSGKKKQQFLRANYLISYDKRDVKFYPIRGYLLQAELQQFGLGAFNDLSFTQLNTLFGYFLKFKKRWSSIHSFKTKLALNGDIPYAQYVGFGYKENFVRGYELSVIDGRHAFLNRNSLRFLLFKKEKVNTYIPIKQFKSTPFSGYLRLHTDHGFVRHTLDYEQPLADQYIWSWGLGLDLVTYYEGVLRAEYSFRNGTDGGFFFHLGMEF